MSYTLSRKSRTYKFVFGKEEGRLEGFPEPRVDKMSLGVFASLFVSMAFLRTLAHSMALLMDAMGKIIGFAIDGTRIRGTLFTRWEKIPIEPWPRLFGKRLSPFLIFGLVLVGYEYWLGNSEDALQYLLFFAAMTAAFFLISMQQGPTATEVIAEAIGPPIEEKIRLSYYREPKFFPPIYLVD